MRFQELALLYEVKFADDAKPVVTSLTMGRNTMFKDLPAYIYSILMMQ